MPNRFLKALVSRLGVFILIGLGWASCAYLLLHTLAQGQGLALLADKVSPIVFCSSCMETVGNPASWQLGFPLAGWGLVYFAIVALLLAPDQIKLTHLALVLSACGAGASLVLVNALVQGRAVACVPCLLVHALNGGVFASLWLLANKEKNTQKAPGSLFPAARSPVILLAGALIAGGAFQATVFYSMPHGGTRVDAEAALASYRSETRHELPREPGDPVEGSAAGGVELVVFSSFQCPGCQSFARTARHLVEHYGGDLTVVFKHFPLSSQCNPQLAGDLQPRSCQAAWAAEAAKLQGAFWPYHDRFFGSTLDASEQTLENMAHELGLDFEHWQTDRLSVEVRSKVGADVELGLRLGVDATPSVFLNGRRVRDFSLVTLEFLIAQEIEALQ